MSEKQPYRPVRALSRGLEVLRQLNRLGSARPADLARACCIDRTTAYRLVATLVEDGLVREAGRAGEFMLTEAVRGLSEGFTERDRVTQLVTPHLGALFQKVVWPTDFATFERGAMVIRETTHRFSPYSVHRAMIGQPRGLLTSALGGAALAGSSPTNRSTMLEIARGVPGSALHEMSAHRLEEHAALIVSDYQKRGYAWSVGGSDGKISAIAVAVASAAGAAAVNLVFFSSAMSVETAAERFIEPLQQCAADIEAALRTLS